MQNVSAYEAKTHLSRLLDQVARGERIMITRHGVPVAELIPAPGRPTRTVSETIVRMRELRAECRLDGLSLRDLINEGRR